MSAGLHVERKADVEHDQQGFTGAHCDAFCICPDAELVFY